MSLRTPLLPRILQPLLPLALLAALGSWAVMSFGCHQPRTPTATVSPRQRPVAEPFLQMPHHGYGELPLLLSQTGAFSDTASLTPAPALLPYHVISPLWSDGAHKFRWLALPHVTSGEGSTSSDDSATISFTPYGEWYFPSGTVAVKHFSLPIDERDPTRLRRLETRILVRSLNGLVYGATYRWRDDQLDAELLNDERVEDITITNRDGSTHTQAWTYPSRAQCLICHNHTAGGILGITTRQLNRAGDDGVNQLATWNALGLFDPPIAPEQFHDLPRLVSPDAVAAPLADRARSYLDANCSHCHRPGALPFVSYDARFETPLERQNLLYARPVIDYGIDRVRYIKPNDPWRSMLLVRLQHSDTMKMPPIGRNVIDPHAVTLIHDWITSMEGPKALAPPQVQVSGDPAAGPITLTVRHHDPQAALHYTLNGALPDDESPRYVQPLIVSAPATVRVKAIRDGFASSIAVLTTINATP